jgi:hypothetical protein
MSDWWRVNKGGSLTMPGAEAMVVGAWKETELRYFDHFLVCGKAIYSQGLHDLLHEDQQSADVRAGDFLAISGFVHGWEARSFSRLGWMSIRRQGFGGGAGRHSFDLGNLDFF